ncbi:hypothetical protein M5D96_000489 [Drosophila gunungcola]|uniref:Uncharacterized protein n=1 Tax=Drosophila gunungcola TaxID=103775 RepID=A0A9P9YX01_9MUSC|nr:hypothetical protein M5D96_000489 [Drosophila gunungcola]
MHKEKEENGVLPHIHAHDGYRTRELGAFEHGLLDGDMFLQVSRESRVQRTNPINSSQLPRFVFISGCLMASLAQDTWRIYVEEGG